MDMQHCLVASSEDCRSRRLLVSSRLRCRCPGRTDLAPGAASRRYPCGLPPSDPVSSSADCTACQQQQPRRPGSEKSMETVAACEIACLAEKLLCTVISRTAPRDACRAASVSSAFRAAVDSNAGWIHRRLALSSSDPRLSRRIRSRLAFSLVLVVAVLVAPTMPRIFEISRQSGRRLPPLALPSMSSPVWTPIQHIEETEEDIPSDACSKDECEGNCWFGFLQRVLVAATTKTRLTQQAPRHAMPAVKATAGLVFYSVCLLLLLLGSAVGLLLYTALQGEESADGFATCWCAIFCC